MNYQAILDEIQRDIVPFLDQGRAADYIPALARVPPSKFGMALYTLSGETYKVGDADEPFSIQSISKLFACVLAFRLLDDSLWERVGREPSTAAFNSLAQLEQDAGKPRNPLINAGALVVTDIIASRFVQSEMTVLNFLRRLNGNPRIDYNLAIAESEREHASRNLAMAHFMKSFGNLANPADAVVDAYCRQCAIEMSCVDLAKAVALFANHGVAPSTGERVLHVSSTKRLCALMLTCGTYDGVGDFVYRVGLPAKSGVGGGIVAVLPGEMGICVWSPGLDRCGNSLAGVQALEWFTTRSGRSIF